MARLTLLLGQGAGLRSHGGTLNSEATAAASRKDSETCRRSRRPAAPSLRCLETDLLPGCSASGSASEHPCSICLYSGRIARSKSRLVLRFQDQAAVICPCGGDFAAGESQAQLASLTYGVLS